MSYILTTNSTVSCKSQGSVSTSGQTKLKVNGGAALTLAGINGQSVKGCTTPSSQSSKPCSSVTSVSGAASKLKVGGAAVALDSLTGSTDGTVPTLSATAGHTKLKAV